ncbi:MAG: glutamate--tRNA ligase [Planctomycetota bacterium]
MAGAQDIRVRFAPSPTGMLHIGGARTALYNWLFARHHGGTFILRIEDTDRTRSTDAATQQIIVSLRWLGLDWDEGPIHQSDRLATYRSALEELLVKGAAYEQEDERGKALRLRVSREKQIALEDTIHGPVQFDARLIEDFVILKADGFPTYNFACAVDDHSMGITHVIRGDDHISNTPRQLLLYDALGWEPPKFAHVPMILGADGERLSKRHGATGVDEYRRMGFLSEALVNFLALLGWSPGDDREVLGRDELVHAFDLGRVRATASRFDLEKLEWLNAQHLKMLDEEGLAREVAARLRENFSLEPGGDVCLKLARLYRERLRKLAENIERDARYLFAEEISWDEDAKAKAFAGVSGAEILDAGARVLEGVADWTEDAIESALRSVAEELHLPLKKVAQPVRYAVTGSLESLPLFDVLSLVGRERVLRRIRRVLGRMKGG